MQAHAIQGGLQLALHQRLLGSQRGALQGLQLQQIDLAGAVQAVTLTQCLLTGMQSALQQLATAALVGKRGQADLDFLDRRENALLVIQQRLALTR